MDSARFSPAPQATDQYLEFKHAWAANASQEHARAASAAHMLVTHVHCYMCVQKLMCAMLCGRNPSAEKTAQLQV